MRIARHRLLPALLAALASLLVVMPAAPAAGHASKGTHAKQRPAVRSDLGTARSLGRQNRCSKRLAPERARRMTAAKRKQMVRQRRNCRRLARPSSAPSGPLYWGAWIGNQLTGDEAPWDMSAATKFEQMAGKPMSLVHFSSPFADCSSSSCSYYDFPSGPMEDIREHGSIPFFSWGSQATPASLNQPHFQLADVISGAHDAYIRQWATAAKNWGKPFFLRFNWEMNGNWFAWMEGVNGNKAGESVTAWRHVHDIFTEVGATNATWVWCPNIDPDNQLRDLSSLYPGDAYVDWTGLDGYNWGTHPARDDAWRSFDDLYRSTYEYITETIAPTKPLAISEVGSTEHGGSKSAWIADALGSVTTNYPMVRALLWFEKYDDGMDWPIETSSSATSAFAAGIQNPAFRANSYANLDAGPIPVAG